ncbi:MAG: hypothetical protein KDB07_07050, partial [Planctomycetes bacterium]|nr:hypothetical protein [Planctomycetota bacterium]
MPSEFRWNRLIIRTESEGEFCAAFEENINSLISLEYDDIECDLSECIALGSRAADLIHWAMVAFGESGKTVLLRIPSTLQTPMQTTPIPKNVTIDWVMRIHGDVDADEVLMVTDTPAPRERSDS